MVFLRRVVGKLRRYYLDDLKNIFAASNDELTYASKPFRDMPGPRGRYALPKIGPMFFFKPLGTYTPGTVYKLWDDLHDKYGRTFAIELLGRCVVTSHLQSVSHIFRHEGPLPDRGSIIRIVKMYARRNNREEGMGTLNGKKWHRLRSASQKHMMKLNSASVYIDKQVCVANDFITRLATASYTPDEFRDELFKYTTELTGVVCFNKRLGFLDPGKEPLTSQQKQFLNALALFFVTITKHVSHPLYKTFPSLLYKDFEKTANTLYSFGELQIQETLAKSKSEEREGCLDRHQPNLILSLLSGDIGPETVNTIILDLLTAGTDSTAKNMEVLLVNLALNPDKQQLLYEEIVRVIGLKDREMSDQHIHNMPYFRACMKESFRITFPVSSGSPRVLPKDLVIDGYMVPKGTLVFVNSRRLCLDADLFESPNIFKPERWLRDNVTLKRDKDIPVFAFLPFSFGARSCLGRRFAEQMLWIGVVKIIQNFHISVKEKEMDYEVLYSPFAEIKYPRHFTFTPR